MKKLLTLLFLSFLTFSFSNAQFANPVKWEMEIEKKGKELDYDEVKYLLQYTENKNTIATKIIEKIGYHHLDSFVMKLLLSFSKNKELLSVSPLCAPISTNTPFVLFKK